MRRLFDATAAALLFLLIFFAPHARAQNYEKPPGETQAARVRDIQAALKEARLDGWLFYDFRRSDPLAYRILKLDDKSLTVGSSRVDLQACKLEYSIVSPK